MKEQDLMYIKQHGFTTLSETEKEKFLNCDLAQFLRIRKNYFMLISLLMVITAIVFIIDVIVGFALFCYVLGITVAYINYFRTTTSYTKFLRKNFEVVSKNELKLLAKHKAIIKAYELISTY